MSRFVTNAGMSFCFFLISIPSISAQSKEEILYPHKTDVPPVIDGVLNDQVWQVAPSETGFRTYSPDYGIDMVENTVVWYAYDRENLYFAFRCYDSQPDQIKTSVTARDRIRSDDWICINLDTFNDHQSLFVFYTNPMGIQMDSRATAVSEDMSADFVWFSAGRIDDEGYSVELKIPFKSIRFSYREPVEMGIIFERYISRLSQAGTYPALDPRHGPNFLTQTRPLFYKGIEHYRLVELIPAVTYGSARTTTSESAGSLVSYGDESSISLTGKLGITSHLVLDGTINPDYSQVEADAGQIDFNQRFPLFFAEKRPFFLEGREFFDFGAAGGGFLNSVVYTRTIRDPSFGVKLTGKIGDQNTIASIYAVDKIPSQEDATSSIFRYKRALSNDSFIGGFFTQRDQGSVFNRVVGADGLIRLNPSNTIGFHAFSSQDEDPNSQLESNGRALGLDYTYMTRDWIVNVQSMDLTDGFNTETGFVNRTGVTRYQFGVLKFLYPEPEGILRFDVLFHSLHTRDHASGLWEEYNAFDIRPIFGRNSMVQMGYILSNEVYLGSRYKTSNLRIVASSQFTKRLFMNLRYRNGKKIQYSDQYQGKGTDLSGGVTYQYSDHLSSSLSVSYSDFFNDETSEKEYDYTILRNRNTYQINKYLFVRGIAEYNDFYEELNLDFLVSFTYIPGTVIHFGYGSVYNRIRWDENVPGYVAADRFLETRRGLFFKASYLWRM